MNKQQLLLDPLFNDHMVIQRNKAFSVWGRGPNGVQVTVTCLGESASTEVKDGLWSISLPAMGATSEPCELIVQTTNSTITLKDVLFGDVWLAGGQSNMEWSLSESDNAELAIAGADLPLVRFYDVPKVAFEVEGINYKGRWKTCDPQNAGKLSAVAYYFARDLVASEGVAIGIIGCNWGGTSASCWMNEETLKADPELSIYLKEFAAEMQGFDWSEFKLVHKQYNDALGQYNRKFAAGIRGDELGEYPWPPPLSPHSFTRPSGLYETMLSKLFRFRIKGVIFYQGESDSHHPEIYSRLLEALILDWRQQWDDAKLPFLFVQLPVFAWNGNPDGTEWPLIREAQQLVAEKVAFTGMAVILDEGEAADIHPLNKKPVGERLALLALDKVYGRDIKSSGPVFRTYTIEGNQVVVEFNHAGTRLAIRAGNPLVGFELAADDNVFMRAEAVIQGSTVRVSCGQISSPRSIRYGWANVTNANLVGQDGLPAAPFRTK